MNPRLLSTSARPLAEHQLAAREITLRACAAVLVINCLDGTAYHPHAESWIAVLVAIRRQCLRICLNKASHADYPG